MFVLNLIRVILVLIVSPILIGVPTASLLGMYEDRRVYRFAFAFIIGNLMTFAAMQIISVPLVLSFKSLTAFAFLYSVVIILAILGLNIFGFLNAQRKKTTLYTRHFLSRVINGFKRVPKWVWVLLIAAILLFLFMEYHYMFRIHVDDDDARYMGNPASAVFTNTLYEYDWGTGKYAGMGLREQSPRDAVSPWMLSYAVWCKLTGVNSTIIAHSIMSVILFAICFMEYFLLSDRLFKSDMERMITFMLMICVVYLTFSGNTHTQAAVSLVRIWQGKAAFATTVIPFMLYLYMSLANAETDRTKYYIEAIFTALAGCYMSGVGIVGTGLFMGPFFFWDILRKRKWKELFLLLLVCIPTLVYGYMYAKIK